MRIVRRILVMLAATILFIALPLACIEIWASTTTEGNAALFTTDPDLYVVRKPGDGYTYGNARWIPVHINRQGLRGDELPEARDPQERWMLCIGDSFTFGGGVETDEAWPQQLQKLLGEPATSKVRVLNGGANGWDTGWQRLYLERRGLEQIRPAVVVLGFNWNDLDTDGQAPQRAIENFVIPKHGPFLVRTLARWEWTRETHIYRWLYSRRQGSAKVPTEEEMRRWYQDYQRKRFDQAIDPERKLVSLRQRRFGDGKPDMTFWVETDTPNWRSVRSELARMDALCKAAGVKLLVALLTEPTWDGPGTFPAVERMAALLDHLGIPWLDLQPAFLARTNEGIPQGKRPGLWLQYDPFHPTPEGQRIFAEQIAAKLRELRWLD